MVRHTKLQDLLEFALSAQNGLGRSKIAIRFGARNISYQELDHCIRQTAAGMRANGIQKGDRVAWFLPNCPEAVFVTLACYQIGAVAVPLNYRYVASEAQDVLERTRAKLLIAHQDRAEVTQLLTTAIDPIPLFEVGGRPADGPSRNGAGFEELLKHDPLTEIADVEGSHPALILFTSGSTGRPKGVVHSHDSAFCGIDISRRIFDFADRDVVLVGKPISHAGGLQTQLMPTLLVGGETILAMKPTPAEAAALIARRSVTQYGLLASDLLDFIEFLEQHPTPLPTLKNSIGSGDSVPVDLHHRFRDLFGWEVMEGAGMTEIGGYYAANPRDGQRKWGSLGLPTPDTQLRIVDEDGTDASAEQVGEIVVRTPAATIGYWEAPEATHELFCDGWLHTGDLAHFDAEGFVWFVGRKKLMIVRRGSNIAPAEVENVIDEHPLVHASVVVGVADDRDGQVPVAFVAKMEDGDKLSEDELRDYVRDRLAAYKNPTRYLFLKELPRTSTGKFDRHRLEELAAAIPPESS